MDPLGDFLVEYGLYLGIPILFLAIVAWTFRPSAKKRYQADGNIPFSGDKKGDNSIGVIDRRNAATYDRRNGASLKR